MALDCLGRMERRQSPTSQQMQRCERVLQMAGEAGNEIWHVRPRRATNEPRSVGDRSWRGGSECQRQTVLTRHHERQWEDIDKMGH